MNRLLHHISKRLAATITMVVVSLLWVSCSIDLGSVEDTGGDGGVTMSFALSLAGNSGSPDTKMSQAVVQTAGASSFRGIEYVYAIPFDSHAPLADEATASPVSASDSRWFENLELRQRGISNSFADDAGNGSHTGLVNNNNSHLYGLVYVKRGTGSMLVYGKAVADGSTTSVADKHRNGVLEPTTVSVEGNQYSSLLAADYPGQIGFNLEPIASGDDFTATVNGLLDYLTGIANTVLYATYNNYPIYTQTSNPPNEAYRLTYTWSNPSSYNSHTTLSTQYQDLTGGAISLGGLGAVLSGIYSQLNGVQKSSNYRVWYSYYGSNGWRNGSDYYYYSFELARAVMANIDNSQYVTVSGTTVTLKDTYAAISDGLPAGAARVQYNSTTRRFELASGSGTVRINGVDVPVAPVSSFCYPPSLWYHTNSNIRVTDDKTIESQYVSGNSTWQSIISRYDYGTVASSAVSAAVVKPLNYGVGMLQLKINMVASSPLRDNTTSGTVAVNNTNFPLTGIIIGGQKNLNFDFTPRTGETYYTYDNNVNTAYISSTTASSSTNTLAVQTIDGDDIRFALEFQNNSGNSFQGSDGTVPSGGRFYLIGELKYSDAAGQSRSNSVFRQDLVTSVTVTISSLENAFNTIPDFRTEMLQIGVKTQMKWIQATPAENPLY